MDRFRLDMFVAVLVLGCATTPSLAQRPQEEKPSPSRLSAIGFNQPTSLQERIDQADSFLFIPAAEYELDAPLQLRSNLFLQFEPGTRVIAAKGAFRGIEDSLILIAGLENVTIQAEGCSFIMRRDDYRDETVYKSSEWRHILSIQGSRNITIDGGRYESSGGDGICIGPLWIATEQVPSVNVLILGVTCHDNWRQGISVLGGKDLLIANSLFSGTLGTSPQAGIDIEPEYGNSVDIMVHGCHSKGNRGPAYMVNLVEVTPARSVRIEFKNCSFSGVPADQSDFRTVAVFNDRGRLDDHLPSGAFLEWNGLVWTKP